MLKKKAISPLIATILLIGFTVVIAAMLFAWAGDFFTEKHEEENCELQIEDICVKYVGLSIDIVDPNANFPNISLENSGSYPINKINLLSTDKSGNQNSDTITFTIPASGFEPNTFFYFNLTTIKTSDLKNIKATPIIKHQDNNGNICEKSCSSVTYPS